MGRQLERVLSAEVLHACTGMEPTRANSLRVCGDLHESVRMTEKPGAQLARLCGHGEM